MIVYPSVEGAQTIVFEADPFTSLINALTPGKTSDGRDKLVQVNGWELLTEGTTAAWVKLTFGLRVFAVGLISGLAAHLHAKFVSFPGETYRGAPGEGLTVGYRAYSGGGSPVLFGRISVAVLDPQTLRH